MFNKEDVDPTTTDIEALEQFEFETKFHSLAYRFIRKELDDHQRKMLGVLVTYKTGISALKDEVPEALADQAYDGDDEAWEILNGSDKVLDKFLKK